VWAFVWVWGKRGVERDIVNSLCPTNNPSPHNIQYRIQNTEYKIWNTKSYVHKITNVPVFYMALGVNDFDAGKSNTWAIGKGGP
jgi:hypothetical protein